MNNLTIYSWQARAIATYQSLQAQSIATAGAELAARLGQLLGRGIDSRAIYIDEDTHAASLIVDGVLFRMRHQELVIVRACPSCGQGHYESAAIASMAELGFALSAWQPPCANCEPEDAQVL